MSLMNTLNCGAMMAAMEMDAELQNKKRKNARYWVSPYLKERIEKGRFMSDFEASSNSPCLFVENFRMPAEVFDELYEMLEPRLLPKRNSRPKDFIPIKAKLAVVLEYVASGDLQRHSGKHINIKAPPKSGIIFYNYKGFHSIVLLATCDANYKFTYLDIGADGSEGDSHIIRNSKFGTRILNDTCLFPLDRVINKKKNCRISLWETTPFLYVNA